MKPFFKEMFQYSHHYNQKLGEIFLENPDKVSDKATVLLSHILNAHRIWNNRIEARLPALGLWDIHQAEHYQNIDKDNFEHSLLVLDTLDLDHKIDYVNSKGQPYTTPIRDILFHTANHATYHRAQIASDFKLNGLEPLPTDYIFYKWQGF